MAIETNQGSGRPSPFSRPPQPRATPTFVGSVAAPRTPARPAGSDVRPQAPAAPDAGPALGDTERTELEAQRRAGGQWFYWVAALSLINSVLAMAGQEWRFILGLGVTQVVEELASSGLTAGLVSLAVIGIVAVLGHKAVQGAGWAFLAGMTLYALDGAIFLVIQHWLGVGFHAFALAMIMRGYLAARKL